MAFLDAYMCTIFRIVEMVKCTIISPSQQWLTSDWYSNMCQLSFSVSLEVWYPHETRTQSLPSIPPSPSLSFALSFPYSPLPGWGGDGGGDGGFRQKQTGVQVCDVWHVHTACVPHREETCLTGLTPAWLPPDSQAMITLSLCVDVKVRGESRQTYRQTMMQGWGCGKNLNIKHVSKNPILC